MGSPDKIRFPRDVATAVALELLAALTPGCERILFAGSYRRRRAEVGDLEVLYIPKRGPAPDDFFADQADQADGCIARLEASRILRRRLNVNGTETFGAKNKLMVHTLSGLPVDLFVATRENWFNYLVCRTGPATSNTALAAAALARGYRWQPYGAGFTRLSDGEVIPMGSEAEVFDFVRMPFLAPHRRGLDAALAACLPVAA